MIRDYSQLIERVKSAGEAKRVAVAASHDAHTLEALSTAYEEGLIEPILIGDESKTRALIEELKLPFKNAAIINTSEDAASAREAVAMIKDGIADFIMKGKLQTADLLREVVNKETGLKHGPLMSHFGFFEVPGYHKLLVLTDGGMVLRPDLAQKREILRNTVDTLSKLGYAMPKAACLCATEVVNPKMPESVDAGKLKEMYESGEISDCIVEGPISYDLMISKESAKIKAYESPVTGDTDILLMPDMTAGNLVAKVLMLSAGAKMAGIIVGAEVPIVLVSRGATAEEKYLSLVLAAAMEAEK